MRIVAVLATAVGLGGLFVLGLLRVDPSAKPEGVTSMRIEAFELPVVSPLIDEYGPAYAVSSTPEQPVVLNFWASWCTPCHAEASDLEATWQKFAGDVQFVGVNTLEADHASAAEFVNRYGLTFPQVLDQRSRTGISYGIFSVPETYVFDSEGELVRKYQGPIDPAELTTLLGSLH